MEIPRTRDVVTFQKGVATTTAVSPSLVAAGWNGGQGAMWLDSPDDTFLVTFSDGSFGGFLLWGSNESSDQYLATTASQLTYSFAVLCTGTWIISTSTFEKYTYQSRTGGGPLIQNVFTVGARLKFSLRGLFTPQDEWTLVSDPRAPNPFVVGYIIESPSTQNNSYLTLQTTL